jgi:hypothetical protein
VQAPAKRSEDDASLAPANIPGKMARTSADSAYRRNIYSYEEFNPTALQGEKAAEWIELLIRRMFKIRSPLPKSNPDADPSEPSELEQYLVQKYTHLLLPPHDHHPLSLCYFAVAKSIRGKFDAKRASELGVPHGPIRGLLTRGETVTLANGTVITPEMCVHPPEPPSVSASSKVLRASC